MQNLILGKRNSEESQNYSDDSKDEGEDICSKGGGCETIEERNKSLEL